MPGEGGVAGPPGPVAADPVVNILLAKEKLYRLALKCLRKMFEVLFASFQEV